MLKYLSTQFYIIALQTATQSAMELKREVHLYTHYLPCTIANANTKSSPLFQKSRWCNYLYLFFLFRGVIARMTWITNTSVGEVKLDWIALITANIFVYTAKMQSHNVVVCKGSDLALLHL